MVRVIYIAHESPGRLRLRLPWLRKDLEAADPLADHLASLPGVEEVRIRPWTGSVLCLFDAWQLEGERILAATKEHTGVDLVLRPGERSEREEEVLAQAALERGSDVAVAFATAIKGMNYEILRASAGRIDLGTIAASAFAVAGAAQVVATRKLPLPPWFNLAWWAFRTFTTIEKPAIQAAPLQTHPLVEEPAGLQEGEESPR